MPTLRFMSAFLSVHLMIHRPTFRMSTVRLTCFLVLIDVPSAPTFRFMSVLLVARPIYHAGTLPVVPTEVRLIRGARAFPVLMAAPVA